MKYLLIAFTLMACNSDLQKKLDQYEAAEKITAQRLIRMDSLDFQFYSNQQWDSLSLSHTDDIKVFYPDGSTSQGLFPAHIDLLKPQFVFAPDTKVTAHPISFGSGEWTCVVGIVEGTFSHVMPAGDKTIPPTGKRFRFPMVTVGHWEGGKMKEEYLFFDNLGIMKQIGLAQ